MSRWRLLTAQFYVEFIRVELARPELRFDVDTPADLARLETLVSRGAITLAAQAMEIVEQYDRVGS